MPTRRIVRLYGWTARRLRGLSYPTKLFVVVLVIGQIPLVSLAVVLASPSSVGLSGVALGVTVTAVALASALALYLVVRELCAPVQQAGRALASYLMEHELPDLPSDLDDEVGALMRDVVHVCSKLEDIRQSGGLGNLRDPVTGLPSRLAAEEELPKAAALARRAGLELRVGVVDVQGLRHVNDEHGPVVGDRVLTRVALVLRGGSRLNDLIVRWDDDQFVVVSHGSGPGIGRMIERAHETLRAEPLDHDGRRVAISITSAVSTATVGEDIFDCIARTDRERAAIQGESGAAIASR